MTKAEHNLLLTCARALLKQQKRSTSYCADIIHTYLQEIRREKECHAYDHTSRAHCSIYNELPKTEREWET